MQPFACKLSTKMYGARMICLLSVKSHRSLCLTLSCLGTCLGWEGGWGKETDEISDYRLLGSSPFQVKSPLLWLPCINFRILFIFFFTSLTKDVTRRPKYRELLKHPFILRYEEKQVDVGSWLSGVLAQAPLPKFDKLEIWCLYTELFLHRFNDVNT